MDVAQRDVDQLTNELRKRLDAELKAPEDHGKLLIGRGRGNYDDARDLSADRPSDLNHEIEL